VLSVLRGVVGEKYQQRRCVLLFKSAKINNYRSIERVKAPFDSNIIFSSAYHSIYTLFLRREV
jgi:hypothetical protein